MLTLSIEHLELGLDHHDRLGFADAVFEFGAATSVLRVGGDNGVGKTTLLNALSGHASPRRGRVLLDGIAVSGRGPRWATRHGVLRGFQSPLLCDELKVWENIGLPLLGPWWARASSVYRRVSDELEGVSMASVIDKSPDELSYGQRRIVELLRIKLQAGAGARLLLLDEPFAGLDPDRSRAASRLITQLIAGGTPAVLVEHDPSPLESATFGTLDVFLAADADTGVIRFDGAGLEGPLDRA